MGKNCRENGKLMVTLILTNLKLILSKGKDVFKSHEINLALHALDIKIVKTFLFLMYYYYKVIGTIYKHFGKLNYKAKRLLKSWNFFCFVLLY